MDERSQSTAGDAAWFAFVAAAKDFAAHLDQWEKIKFETKSGMVYVSISREAPYPDAWNNEYDNAKDGEPMWIILGRDPVYEETVEFWARARERAILDGRIEDTPHEREHIATARRYVAAGWRST